MLTTLPLLLMACAGGARNLPPGDILVFGDSLSAGYKLDEGEDWVSLLQEKMAAQGNSVTLVNASVSGETTAGGLSRLPLLLDTVQPKWVIIELGANDGLRGVPLRNMQENLLSMIQLARDAGAKPLLFGMLLPLDEDPAYRDDFEKVFREVGQDTKTPLLPFFLDGVAANPEFNLDDGLHPNARAQPVIRDNVWAFLSRIL